MAKIVVYALVLLAVAASYGAVYKIGKNHGTDSTLVATLAQREKELAEAKQEVEKAIKAAADEKEAAAKQRQSDQDAQIQWQREEEAKRQKSLDSIRKHFEKSLSESAECSNWQHEVVPCPVE